MITPVIIIAVVVVYTLVYAVVIFGINEIPLAVKILMGLILIGAIGFCIYVLVERIKEIRSGEEDDLDKY